MIQIIDESPEITSLSEQIKSREDQNRYVIKPAMIKTITTLINSTISNKIIFCPFIPSLQISFNNSEFGNLCR